MQNVIPKNSLLYARDLKAQKIFEDSLLKTPIYFTNEDLGFMKSVQKQYCLERLFQRRNDGKLKVTHQDTNKNVSQVKKEQITEFLKCLLKGKVSGMSLPTKIFEPRSQMERIADMFSLAPDCLQNSINSHQDRIE